MYWFAGAGIAQQIINTAKLPVLSKILKKSTVRLKLIESIFIVDCLSNAVVVNY